MLDRYTITVKQNVRVQGRAERMIMVASLFWQIIWFRSYYIMIFLWRWRVILWLASVLLATWTTHTVAVLFYVMIIFVKVEGDSLSGICFVGYMNYTYRGCFVLLPVGIVICVGMSFLFSGNNLFYIFFNPLSPHDACKHHFTSLKTNSIFLQNEYFHETGLPIHSNFL